MNAGAFSQEICQTLIDVEVIDNDLNIMQLNSRDIGFSYRRAPGLDDKIILQARFRLAQDDTSRLIEHIRQIIALRRNRQPLQWPSCGSVFKRPEGDYAGRLIEAAGLKGMTVGGAQIAEDHANFIINKKKATSEDVLKLIKMAKKKVQEEFNTHFMLNADNTEQIAFLKGRLNGIDECLQLFMSDEEKAKAQKKWEDED